MALTLRGNGQISADNYQIDSDGSIISDTNTLYVDAANNSVGIGTTSSYPLTVQSGTAGSSHAIALRNNTSTNISRLGFLQENSSTLAYSSIDGDGRTTGFLRFNTNDTERMRIDQNGYVTKPSHPAFVASGNLSPTSFTSGSAIVFDDGILNRGSVYNTSTGIFTAPVGGLYQFGTSVRIESGIGNMSYHRIIFYKNGTGVQHSKSRLNFHVNGNYSHCANDLLIELSVNDYVQVVFTGSPAGPHSTSSRDEMVFYGYLVG